MKRTLNIFIIMILIFMSTDCQGQENQNSSQPKASIFPQSEYEKNFIFPPIIGPLTMVEKNNFEDTRPGLGYAIQYVDHITTLTIYVYDLLIDPIPDDVTSDVVVKAFQSAGYEIIATEKMGDYTDLTYSHGRKINLMGKDMLLGTFEYVANKTKKYSILMLTVHKGKFFKVRLTINKEKDESYEADTFEIIKEITEKILMEEKAKGSV